MEDIFKNKRYKQDVKTKEIIPKKLKINKHSDDDINPIKHKKKFNNYECTLHGNDKTVCDVYLCNGIIYSVNLTSIFMDYTN